MALEGEARLQAATEAARESGTRARRRAEEHQVSYRRWKLVGTTLNVGAAVLASAAGATLLSSAKPGSAWAITAGVFGLLSSVFISAAAQLGANNEAQNHNRAAANYAALANTFLTSRGFLPSRRKRDMPILCAYWTVARNYHAIPQSSRCTPGRGSIA